MSKVSISGNNAGTGTFTIAAPDSNNNRQIDLPDLAGTVLTDTTDLEPQVKTSLNATGSAPVYACRAWVNFDGTGTVSIRDSGNVSSITDNGNGDYTVNFATAMPDSNFSAVGASLRQSLQETDLNSACLLSTHTTSSVRIVTGAPSLGDDGERDSPETSVAIFR